MIDDSWADAKEVSAPVNYPTKKCEACGAIYLPKWHTTRRCEFCRKNKNFAKDDPRGNKDIPFG